MKSLVSACSGALLLLLSFPGHTFAQVNATLGGTVSDANGGVIPKVEVTAKNVNTGIQFDALGGNSDDVLVGGNDVFDHMYVYDNLFENVGATDSLY